MPSDINFNQDIKLSIHIVELTRSMSRFGKKLCAYNSEFISFRIRCPGMSLSDIFIILLTRTKIELNLILYTKAGRLEQR